VARASAPLRHPDFFKLWAGQLVSVVGDKINQIALAVLVYAATGSMLQMGIMLGVSALPAVLFGVFAGVFADRWDRRLTMAGADIARALLVLSIPFVASRGVAWVYLVAFAVSSVSLLFEPAKRSLIADLVPADELMAANSLDNASSAIAELAGLAFGGALIALMDVRSAFAIDAVTYVISAVMVFSISFREPETAGEGAGTEAGNVFSEAAAGLRHTAGSPVLRSLLVVYAAAAVAVGAAITVMNALALRTFRAGAPGLAALDAAITVGILFGSFTVARSGSGSAGLKFLWGLTAFALLIGVLATAPGLVLAALVLVLTGVANMWVFIPMQSIVQTAPPPAMRGRVISVMTSANRVLFVIGLVGAGALLEQTGTATLLAGIGIILLLAASLGWTRRALREA
jgi:MFS transporter, DHA3 family, macrolide efflux protein